MVRADAGFVERACNSFEGEGAGCASLAGRPVRIEQVNEQSRTMLVWAPPGTQQEIAYYALTPHTPIVMTASLTQAEMQAVREGGVNYDSRLVMTTSAGMTMNWYVLAMHEQPGVDDQQPWVPVIKDRWDYWCDLEGSSGIKVLIADVGTRLIDYVNDCSDLTIDGGAAWSDRDGVTCAQHRSLEYCTEAGVETDAYKNSKNNNNRKTFDSNQADGMYAPKACCGCGGGSLGGNVNTLPAPLTGMGSSQVLVM